VTRRWRDGRTRPGSPPESQPPDMTVRIGSVTLPNPVMTASGTFGYGREYCGIIDLSKLGAIVVKGTTLHPRDGNPPPRVVETPSGMLNSIGLQNPGVDAFLETELPFLRQFDVPVVLNIAGHSVAEYEEITRRVDGAPGLSAIEVNISCPNVEAGGMAFGVSASLSHDVVKGVRRATNLPIIAKLSPNVTSIVDIARACVDAGADSLSVANTLVGMAIDIKRKRPVLANRVGGMSGPAVKPVMVRMVWEVASALDVPIVGIGGVSTAEDALEFMMAGATAVQVGAAVFRNPTAPLDVANGLLKYCETERLESIREVIGAARRSR